MSDDVHGAQQQAPFPAPAKEFPISPPALNVIHLNGPINSGKSTVGAALAALLPAARFIDGDDHDAPSHLPYTEQWELALARITRLIGAARDSYLVVAYPLDQEGYERILAACERRSARLRVITLAPTLAAAQSDRGGRILTEWERQRVAQMYREGYASRPFSDWVLDTSSSDPASSAREIARRLAAS
ncbi:shikimate kinase [Achromobacter sp. RTa]|uniref:shikimate kinase n=1 Tax=Achromobacter sp. RTa TaxID=1532557 RepID=UPI001E517526|nr:shikimate kinase [Achromobacter sp. RTa]